MSPSPSADEVRRVVRGSYGQIVRAGRSGCCSPQPCCSGDKAVCGPDSARVGYSQDELDSLPAGADLSLGCGNPQAIASLAEGETVVDLGSGAGIDCFLASKAVGPTGRVIGLDMTPDMVARSRELAAAEGYDNVDFRLGEIEHMPVADGSVDCIISNCVVNLSPDKPGVYAEAFRVLAPGGRLAISDIVATAEMPPQVRNDLAAIAGCIAGAARVDELEAMLTEVGFVDVRIRTSEKSRQFIREWLPDSDLHRYVASATIEAVKPSV